MAVRPNTNMSAAPVAMRFWVSTSVLLNIVERGAAIDSREVAIAVGRSGVAVGARKKSAIATKELKPADGKDSNAACE